MLLNRPRPRRNFFRKAQVAPYQSRRFQNPFFKEKAKRKTWLLALSGVLLGFVIALTSFFFTAPIFSITSVRVEGVETIKPEEIRIVVENYLSSSALFIFHKNNRFLFDEQILRKKIDGTFAFSELIIKREGKTLAIIVKERTSSFLWQNSNQSFLLDANGTVIREISNDEVGAFLSPPPLFGATKNGEFLPETAAILVFYDLNELTKIVVGQPVLTTQDFNSSRNFYEALRGLGIYLQRFELNQEVGTWMKVLTNDNYYILFDPRSDVTTQVNNLNLVLKNQIKDINQLEYIDVRFGDHVYYK